MFHDYKWIDLTHPLHPAVPTWDGGCGFASQLVSDYDQSCRVQKLTLAAGIGTHMLINYHHWGPMCLPYHSKLSMALSPPCDC